MLMLLTALLATTPVSEDSLAERYTVSVIIEDDGQTVGTPEMMLARDRVGRTTVECPAAPSDAAPAARPCRTYALDALVTGGMGDMRSVSLVYREVENGAWVVKADTSLMLRDSDERAVVETDGGRIAVSLDIVAGGPPPRTI